MKRLLLAGTLLALSGCGYYDARSARDPLTSPIIGKMGFPDLYHCMGPYDTWAQVDADVFDVTWGRAISAPAVQATLTGVASISLGGGGGCKANFTIFRNGTVAGLDFPASYSNSLLSAPYAQCGPLISECLNHGDSTGISAGYDVSLYLDPAKRKK